MTAPAPAIKLVHLITDLQPGGAEHMLVRLLPALQKQGYAQTVITLTPGGSLAEAVRSVGIPLYELAGRTGTSLVASACQLARLLRRLQPALLQTWLYHADTLGLLCGRITGVKRILWYLRRSGPKPADPAWISSAVRLNAFLSRWVDRILANSTTGAQEHIAAGYPPEKIQVITNGFDTERFHPYTKASNNFVIGYAGRYQAIKNIGTLLAAAHSMVQRHPEVLVLMAGQGLAQDNTELVAQIRALQLQNHVRLLGLQADMPHFYQGCDVFTLCSQGEGFPNVVAEAMACGVPCVVTDVGDAAAIIGDTGIVVPPGHPEALLKGWQTLYAEAPQKRVKRSQKARQRIIDYFSLAKIAAELDQAYQTCLA
jgi:glycosyltransferase involved in cell wall biosynthesis